MSLACTEAELEFYFLKYFLTSYSPSTQFLAFRSIWGFLKWSQMIPHISKHRVCHQNHVCTVFSLGPICRTKFRYRTILVKEYDNSSNLIGWVRFFGVFYLHKVVALFIKRCAFFVTSVTPHNSQGRPSQLLGA